MSSARAEMIRMGLSRWGIATSGTDEEEAREAIQEMVRGYHPDCELDFTRTLPDFPSTRGPQAMVAWLAASKTALAEVTFSPGDIAEKGDNLVVPVRVTARPKGSGGLIEMDYAYVFRFRGDKIAAATSYRTVDEALQAAAATP